MRRRQIFAERAKEEELKLQAERDEKNLICCGKQWKTQRAYTTHRSKVHK